MIREDWNEVLKIAHLPLDVEVDDYSQEDIVYIGYARPATQESEAKWRIKRLDVSSGLKTKWADGNHEFDNVWTDRATLTYK